MTRLKRKTAYRVIQKNAVLERGNIFADEEILLTGFYTHKKCPHPLRRIEVWDETKKESIVLLTNHLGFGPTPIARIYKDRWQIEIFFKMLKQHLRIKTFVGTSENALHIQIWTAPAFLQAKKGEPEPKKRKNPSKTRNFTREVENTMR